MLRSGLDRDATPPKRLTYMERAAFFTCIGMWGPDKARHYLRDRLIAYLLLEGLRPGEIVRLDTRHLYELPDDTYEVRAPDAFENVGKKFTLEPLTVSALKAYLPKRPTPADGEHALILGQGGHAIVSRYPNMLIRQMATTEPTLAQRQPPVTADVVAHTGFWDTPQQDPDLRPHRPERFLCRHGHKRQPVQERPLAGRFLTTLVDRIEAGHDHDRDPLQYAGEHTGSVIDMAAFFPRTPCCRGCRLPYRPGLTCRRRGRAAARCGGRG
ncbi:hypothetical protein [Streptomyces sp. NPDC001020]